MMRELHNIWRDSYKEAGLDQEISAGALRFAAALYDISQFRGEIRRAEAVPFAKTVYDSDEKPQPVDEKEAVEILRKRASDAADGRKVSRWLLKVAKACQAMRSNPRLKAVIWNEQVRLLGVAIEIREDMSDKERQDLLACWEKVSFRIYGMMYKKPQTAVDDYIRLARDVMNKKTIPIKDIQSRIGEIGKDYPAEDAVEKLRDENCYENWEEGLKYLMCRYEEYLTKEAEEAGVRIADDHREKIWLEKSIEHITPQSAEPDFNVHRLGNLMLLPPDVNSSLKDKPPEEKFSAYRDTGLYTAIEVASTKRKWGLKAIEQRENKILRWAAQEWKD